MIRTAMMLAVGAAAMFGAASAGDMTVAEKFTKHDTDGSGSISEGEFLAAHEGKDGYDEAKAKEKFAKIAGDDGQISLAELEAAYAMHDKEHKSHEKKES